MGYGDEIMGSGMAKGAAARGKRVAFGDGNRIVWHRNNAAHIFAGNPNVAPPGCEHDDDLEWIAHYPGNRAYCRIVPGKRRRWDFTPGTQRIGELYLTATEFDGVAVDPGFVLVESGVKATAPNKQWPVDRYERVAALLRASGYHVLQLNRRMANAETLPVTDFRHACAALARASLYVGPEGGLHHAAAALGVPAVVIFGGFISPEVTGYDSHVNLFSGDGLGCGYIDRCEHCSLAMEKISVEEVHDAATRVLEPKRRLTA
jgi:hypothetical protein